MARKLPAQIKLDGNVGHRPSKYLTTTGLRATGEPVIFPHLPPEARDILRDHLNSFPHGSFAFADSPILNAYAAACALHDRAVIKNCSDDAVVVSGSAKQKAVGPWVRVQLSMARLMMDLGHKIGANPYARLHMTDPVLNIDSDDFELLGDAAHKPN